MPLYTSHKASLNVLYADIARQASQLRAVFCGTPGSIVTHRRASGAAYYSRQYYDADGKQREDYIGAVGDADAEAAAAALRERMAQTKETVGDIRMLSREGFAIADSKSYATLASLHNHRVFAAGAVLIGSHAFGALLNQLGIRAATYATEDIDIARREKLAFEEKPSASLLQMLQQSGIPFVEVPQLNVRQPSSSFKEKGKSRFHVDLLVPAAGEQQTLVAVPELQAHATGLPYLKYLLGIAQDLPILAREGCCLVKAPAPERFALHKLITARIRANRSAKSDKDIFQATVLVAALGEKHPGALEEAYDALPLSARKHVKATAKTVLAALEKDHPRASAEFDALIR